MTDETIGKVFVAAIVLILLVTFNKWRPFLQDYRFTGEGIDIVILGGSVRVFRIWRKNIRNASVVSMFRSPPWPVLGWCGLANRLTTRLLWIRTTGITSYILTPADREAALEALGFRPESHGGRSRRR